MREEEGRKRKGGGRDGEEGGCECECELWYCENGEDGEGEEGGRRDGEGDSGRREGGRRESDVGECSSAVAGKESFAVPFSALERVRSWEINVTYVHSYSGFCKSYKQSLISMHKPRETPLDVCSPHTNSNQ